MKLQSIWLPDQPIEGLQIAGTLKEIYMDNVYGRAQIPNEGAVVVERMATASPDLKINGQTD